MEPHKRRKIVYVITKATWFGAQRYTHDLATALPKEEFEVILAYGQDGLLAEKLRAAGTAAFPIQALKRDVSITDDAKTLIELYRLFKQQQPDIVHLNSSKAGGIGALAARLAGVPRIIFTAHGWPFREPRGSLSRGLMYFFSWLTALLSHKIIVVSDYDLKGAQGMPFVAHKTVRIYNGIPSYTQLGAGEMIRQAFPSGARITGSVGELTKNKNQIALIEQAKKNPDMYVAIVGEGEDRLMLEAAIKKYGLESRVKLFGYLPTHEVLKGFDVFALPSLKEGLPYVLLEAKAAGLPVVANRVGGVGEILDAQDMSQFSLEQMVEKTLAVYKD